jgi:hypothetical protein
VLLSSRWLLIPALATVVVALTSVISHRSRRRHGALVGALAVQVVLRWPPQVFHGFPSIVTSALVLLLAVSTWRRSSRRLRRRGLRIVGGTLAIGFVMCIPLVVAVVIVRSEVKRGEQAAKAAIAGIGATSSSSVTANLRQAVTDTSDASGVLGSWLLAPARLVPVVAQQGRFSASAVGAAHDATAVASAENSAIDYRRLDYHNGRISLANLRAMATPVGEVDRALRAALADVGGSGNPWLVAPLRNRRATLEHELARAAHSANLAVEATQELPGMLGGDGTRNYLVAFMTPSESRGYDGFIGSYGVLTAVNGHVSLTVSGPTTALEAELPPGGAKLTGPADFLARYGRFDPGEYARNATFSPDLPTDADVLAQIYKAATGVQVDGVLAIDPFGLAALLHFTGPIEVPGLPVPLTPSNAAYVLLKQQYTTFDAGETSEGVLRNDFLQSALRVAFDKLVAGSLPSPKAISSTLDPAVVDGRISFWSFHPASQPLIRQLSLAGPFPNANGGDLLAVTTQNAGNNKIDAFLHKSMNDHVSFDPTTGAETAVVTIELTNDAPSSGLPPFVIDDPGAPGVAPGTNATWLSLYSPLYFSSVTIDGVPGSMSTGRELGENVFSQYIYIAPESTEVVRVALTGRVASGTHLRVALRVQPSANPQTNTIAVSASGGASLRAGRMDVDTWRASSTMVQSHTFDFTGG